MLTRQSYTWLVRLALPLVPIRLLIKSLRNRAYLDRFGERMAIGIASCPCSLWLHAVSVGEVNAAAPLLKRVLAEHPDQRIMVTTTTPTGSVQLRRLFADQMNRQIAHLYCPYDLPSMVDRFLDSVQPDQLILMETELWPNIIAECEKRQIPVLLANARLSERSARRYAKFPTLVRAVLSSISIAAQADQHRDRFIALGADPDRVQVSGSLKFEQGISDAEISVGRTLREKIGRDRQVWIAGSTRDGEEALLLDTFHALRKQHPRLLLILVPRHPERFDEVIKLCRSRSFIVEQRSISPPGPDARTDIYVGDTMGELPALYAAADAAFIGGSLKPFGGQNMLEAIAANTPPVFGPSTHNFAEVARAVVEAGAGFQVDDTVALRACLHSLLSDEARRISVARAGRELLRAGRGATLNHMQMISQ